MDSNMIKSRSYIPKNKGYSPNSNLVPKNNHGKHQGQGPRPNNNFKSKQRDSSGLKNNQPFNKQFKGINSTFNPQHAKKHKAALTLALEEYKTKKIEEQKRREENKNRKEEMNKALQRYKEKKAQKLKRLCKKTKKGQPIMKYWIEDILQKIQSSS